MYLLYGLFGGGLSLLPVVLVIILFVKVSNLKKRVRDLELAPKTQSNLASEVVDDQQDHSLQSSSLSQEAASSSPQTLPPADVSSEVSKLSILANVFHWVKEEWLFKLGALLLLLGFGWFVNINNWFGPMGSTLLGIVVGAALLILGAWRIKEDLHQGNIFLVLGLTVILITVYAARHLHGLFNPITALGISFLGTAFVAFVSVKRHSIDLAVATLILAALAPLLVGGAGAGYVELFI